MKLLHSRFKEEIKKNPYLSIYMCFSKAVTSGKYNRNVISKWFYKLVDKDDYRKRDVRSILDYLYMLSKA